MVFDWFQRTVAGSAPDPQVPPSQDAEAASEQAPGFGDPSVVDPQADGAPSGEASGSSPVSTSDPAPPAGSPAPQPAGVQPPSIGAVDEAALDWARQAYARLKAQQQAAAAAAPAAEAPPAAVLNSPPAVSAPELPEVVQEPSPVAPAAAGSSPAARSEPAGDPAIEAGSRQAGAVPEFPAPEDGQPLPAPESLSSPPFAVVEGSRSEASESAPADQPSQAVATPAPSLLELAAAQRQQRLQELTAAAAEVPPAAAPAVPVPPEPQATGQEG
jgi:fused signal recognition particle receptor